MNSGSKMRGTAQNKGTVKENIFMKITSESTLSDVLNNPVGYDVAQKVQLLVKIYTGNILLIFKRKSLIIIYIYIYI